MRGYLNDAQILACVERLTTKKSVDKTVQDIATSLFALHAHPPLDPEAHLGQIREKMVAFHQNKQGSLKPSFLMKLFGKEFPTAVPTFGAVYMMLYQSSGSFKYLYKAQEYNRDLAFQCSIGEVLLQSWRNTPEQIGLMRSLIRVFLDKGAFEYIQNKYIRCLQYCVIQEEVCEQLLCAAIAAGDFQSAHRVILEFPNGENNMKALVKSCKAKLSPSGRETALEIMCLERMSRAPDYIPTWINLIHAGEDLQWVEKVARKLCGRHDLYCREIYKALDGYCEVVCEKMIQRGESQQVREFLQKSKNEKLFSDLEFHLPFANI